MKIYSGVEEFTKLSYAVVTSGTFDGVHIGHQKILYKLKDLAKEKDGETVVITFWPHPRHVLDPAGTDLKLLTTFDERAVILDELGIDHLVKIEFTKEFAQLSSIEFIQKILVNKIGTRKLVIGHDHRFGKNREGSFEHLIQNSGRYGFEVEEISRQDVENIGVSSTKIRQALEKGEIHVANEYLGRNYFLSGKIVEGDKIGRTIGFPTANIHIGDEHKLIPADGVYAVKVQFNNENFAGMLNIGKRPTVGGTTKSIEVNIFNFDRNIYGESLTVQFIRQIRREIKFNSKEELQIQLAKDKELSNQILKD